MFFVFKARRIKILADHMKVYMASRKLKNKRELSIKNYGLVYVSTGT